MTHRPIIQTIPKEYRPMVKAALGAGWTLTRTRQGHPKLTNPDGSYATPIPTAYKSGGLHKRIRRELQKREVTTP